MTMQETATSVRQSIEVQAPVERAFAVFTQEMNSWWPPEHHILKGPVAEMVLEPREGGDVYDRGADGSVCRWARVLAYQPPERLVISWDINTAWGIEEDLERSSEVEIRFIAEGPERTRVELEHRHLERHGEGWEQMREAISSPGGWRLGLEAFAKRAKG